MLKFYFLGIFLMTTIISKSQCAYKSFLSDDKKTTLYIIETEELYTNEDLENGLTNISFAFAVKKSVETGKVIEYYLQIFSIFGLGKIGPIPRQITFNHWTTFNSSVKLPQESTSKTTIESCIFKLTETDFKWFLENTANFIQVSDPVTGKNLNCQINGRLISNQINCIKNLSNSKP